MIDLDLTLNNMLEGIGAGATPPTLDDPADPDFAQLDEVRLVMAARTRTELLAPLARAFARRYADVTPERLLRDVERPLKKAIGNSYKRGNQGDPEKQIRVEVTATRAGAVVSVTDEGEGFDVAELVSRFQRGEVYWTHHGGGFESFHHSESFVSYSNGGRTFLLAFRAAPHPSELPSADGAAALGLASDEDFMTFVIRDELGKFKKRKALLERCRVFLPTRPIDDRPEIRYTLQYTEPDGSSVKTSSITGRLLEVDTAAAEYHSATQIYRHFRKADGIGVPKPMQVFKQHPRILLYEFNPTRDYAELVSSRTDVGTLADVAADVGDALRRIHAAPFEFSSVEDRDALRARIAAQSEAVARAASGSAFEAGAGRLADFLAERADALEEFTPVAVHGAFGWHCVLDAGKKFYLYRFDACRMSHPALDVGGFLADLRVFEADGSHTAERVRAIREAFVRGYTAGEGGLESIDLPLFVGAGILARVERLLADPSASADARARMQTVLTVYGRAA